LPATAFSAYAGVAELEKTALAGTEGTSKDAALPREFRGFSTFDGAAMAHWVRFGWGSSSKPRLLPNGVLSPAAPLDCRERFAFIRVL